MEENQGRSEAPDASPAPRPRRRWGRRVLLALALLLGVVLTAGPRLAANYALGRIERDGSDAIHGTVRVDALDLSWNGRVEMRGLEVLDEAGAFVGGVERAWVDVGMRSLMAGKKDIAVRVDGFDLELVRDAAGEWNVAGLPREREGGAERPDTEGDPLPDAPPDLEGRIELFDGTITLRTAETLLQLADVTLSVGLDGELREYTVVASARLAGGDGSAADFALDGALWPDAAAGVRIDEMAVRGFEVAVLREVLAIVGAPLDPASTLAGEVDLVATGGIDGFGDDAALDLRLEGEARDLLVDIQDDGLEVARFEDALATLSGRASRAAGSAPRAEVSLRAKGDRVRLDLAWDAAAEEGLTATAVVDDLAARAGLEPLLARVHPAFAAANAVEGAALDGLVSTRIDLRYGSPLSLEAGAAGFDASSISATGELAVAEGLVETSPLFADLLELFGRSDAPTFDLAPLRFQLDGGALSYADPWTWTIDGVETSFAGGVGLDGALDLTWRVPIEGALAQRNDVLRAFAGEVIEVPLGGTLKRPSLGLDAVYRGLAQRAGDAARRELEARARDRVEEELERARGDVEEALGGLLGGGSGGSGENTAASLLKRADELWDSGGEAEAAPLYRRLRKDFPLSPEYLLNRTRVKARQGQ